MPVAQILVVCTGNICRSPYVERTLQNVADAAWSSGEIVVTSAGSAALVGEGMDAGSRSRLEERGMDADGFVARQIDADMVRAADLILTAERAHRGAATRLHPRALRYTFAIADFADLASGIPDGAWPVREGDPVAWINGVVAAAAAQRSVRTPLPADQADILDPYQKGPRAFDRMAAQVDAMLPALSRALGA